MDLFPAEQKVYDLALQGLSRKQIADKLFVSEHTIKSHLDSIYKKKNVHSAKELIVKQLTDTRKQVKKVIHKLRATTNQYMYCLADDLEEVI